METKLIALVTLQLYSNIRLQCCTPEFIKWYTLILPQLKKKRFDNPHFLNFFLCAFNLLSFVEKFRNL